jgi:hypothetical protein
MAGEEALGVSGRLEPRHLPLSSSGRLVRVLRAIFQTLVPAVLDAGHDRLFRCGITAELVGGHHAQRPALSSQ